MKKSLLIFLLVLFSFGFSQRVMKRTELNNDYVIIDINADKTKLFSSKYNGACIVYSKSKKEFYLYGTVEKNDIILLNFIKNCTSKFYPEKYISCNYRDGFVYLISQIPNKATQSIGVFKWTEEQIYFIKDSTYDISEMRVNRGNSLIQQNKTLEAIQTFDSVEFADSYYDATKISMLFIISSHKNIDDLVSKRKFKDAVFVYEKVFAFKGFKWFNEIISEDDLKTKLGKGLHGLTYASLQKYCEGYCEALYECKSYDLCIQKAKFYTKYFSNSCSLLLSIANSYYENKDKENAKTYYLNYSTKMKNLKKEKDIPYYVPQRI